MTSQIIEHDYLNASENVAQYMADECGRQCVTIDYFIEHMVDCYGWTFSKENHEYSMDPWKMFDGVDQATEGQSRYITFVSGSEKVVGPNYAVFVQRKDMIELGLTPPPVLSSFEKYAKIRHDVGAALEKLLSDAALLNAAPDLLWFTQQLFNAVDTGMLTLDSPADETLANVMRKGREAIAKAKGDAK
jgi:hypothetical protein